MVITRSANRHTKWLKSAEIGARTFWLRAIFIRKKIEKYLLHLVVDIYDYVSSNGIWDQPEWAHSNTYVVGIQNIKI